MAQVVAVKPSSPDSSMTMAFSLNSLLLRLIAASAGAEGPINDLIASSAPTFATLYLKHIDHTPSHLQPALQAFIETLSSGDQSTRVIVSADSDSHRQCQSGFFHNLYFKLGFIAIDLPPLSQRREDIPLLFHNFLRTDCSRFGIEPPHIDNQA